MTDSNDLLAEYRRLMDCEAFRSQRAHGLYEGWITLSMFSLREYFTPVCEVGAGLVFRCDQEVPTAKLTFPLTSAEIAPDWIEDAFDWSFSITSEERHHEVAATKIMMMVHAGRLDEAANLYQALEPRYPGSYSFTWMTEYLRDHRGLAF